MFPRSLITSQNQKSESLEEYKNIQHPQNEINDIILSSTVENIRYPINNIRYPIKVIRKQKNNTLNDKEKNQSIETEPELT